MPMLDIVYRGFWDRPLSFIVEYKAQRLLFWRSFDEVVDEYEDQFAVFVLPDVDMASLANKRIPVSWEELPQLATRRVGQIAVKDICIDQTYRKQIEASILETLDM